MASTSIQQTFFYLMTFFSNYDYTAPNEMVISEQLIGKDLEIRDHGLT
jgi:hypothetical protein